MAIIDLPLPVVDLAPVAAAVTGKCHFHLISGQPLLYRVGYGTDPFALHLQIGTYVDGGGGFADPALP